MTELPDHTPLAAVVSTGRELHTIGDPPKEGEAREMTKRMKAAVMFYSGRRVLDIAARLDIVPEEVETLIRLQLQSIYRHAEAMHGELKRLMDEYRAMHREVSTPDPSHALNTRQEMHRQAKSEICCDVMQALQLVVDAGWQARKREG